MRILIDTNVILDILQKREPFFADSYRALRTGQALPARIQGKNCVSVYIGEAAERTIAYGNSPMADYTDCTLRNSNQIGAVAFKYTVK